MAARQQSVQHRVGNGCIAEPHMSVLDGQLARHDRRARSRPVVDHLRQVSPRRSIHGGQPPVVQQQDVGARDSGKPTPKPALPCSTRRSSAGRGTRRYSAECPRRQAHAAGAQSIQDLPEPVGPVTRIAVPSSTTATAPGSFAVVHLAVDLRCQALFEAHARAGGTRELLLDGRGHAGKLQARSCARVLFIIMGKSFSACSMRVQCVFSGSTKRRAGCRARARPTRAPAPTLDEVLPIGRDVAHMPVLAGAEFERQRAGRLDALRPVALGQAEQPQAAAVAVLGMAKALQQLRDEVAGSRKSSSGRSCSELPSRHGAAAMQ